MYVLVLILLVLGSLILAPLLGLCGTALMTCNVYEENTKTLYSCDAGVEFAIHHIITSHEQYTELVETHNLTVNSLPVNVTISELSHNSTCEASVYSYNIGSSCQGTTVEAIVDYTRFKGGVAEVASNVTIKSWVIGTHPGQKAAASPQTQSR